MVFIAPLHYPAAMENYCWYQTSNNPYIWSYGQMDGGKVTNVLAVVRRGHADVVWSWSAYVYRDGTVELRGGRARTFDEGRAAAEKSLR